MTIKQQRFAQEYLIDLNATQAAIRAGYSPKSARNQGSRLLTFDCVKKAIDEMLERVKSDKVADVAEVMEYLTGVMRRQYKEVVVVTLNEETSMYVPDNDGTMRKHTIKREVPSLVEIPAKLSDANKAAELIGRRFGMFTENIRLSGDVGVQIVNDIPKDTG